MVTIHLKGTLTEDRQLIVEIPDEIPPGEVQLTLEIADAAPAANAATMRARAKLAAVGSLSTVWKAPPGTVPPTEDELVELGTLPSGASVADLVDEDRGER